MKKLYELRVTFDTGRKIYGPIITEGDREGFVEVIEKYAEMEVFRIEDGSRRIVIPQQMIERSYVEIRRISWLRVLGKVIFRMVTR